MADHSAKRLRIAYDISRLQPGGLNGGIKVHHYEFLKALVRLYDKDLTLNVFCRAALVPELAFLGAFNVHRVHVLGSPGDGPDPRDAAEPLPLLRYWHEQREGVLRSLEIDVLYAGFGFSELSDPAIPQVSLIVDVLHAILPHTLPVAEVSFRDEWYRRVTSESTAIQTNSDSCKAELEKHYGVAPDRVFTIALPLHERFVDVEMVSLPYPLQGKQFFFYPANHWAHKNHEPLLIAFASFMQSHSRDEWALALTGADCERTAELKEMARSLDVENNVHFLGHLDLPTLRTVWEFSRCLVFPSLYEGFGLPLVEAMHFQKRIVCGDIPTNREIAGDAADYFDPRKPTDIARALGEAANATDVPDWAERRQSFQLDRECSRLFQQLKMAADDTRK